MPVVVTVIGSAEAKKYLADLNAALRTLGSLSVRIGTPLPRGIFVDVGTRRGTRATHWLSGALQAAGRIVAEAVGRGLAMGPTAIEGQVVGAAGQVRGLLESRAPRNTGRLRGSIKVIQGGRPGGRLGRR